ncbi:class I SAM-dependent methyltransferase [Endozoicomonas sp.]|nr:class I SAM-dependent methyltransferase [Endozoicomonas sp.]
MTRTDHPIGYDAAEYASSKHYPYRLWVEKWSVFSTLQQLELSLVNATAGDFGSGTGTYTRLLLDWGAHHVLAIDGDHQMIEQARKDSFLYNNNITYRHSLLETTKGREDLTVVLGNYLFSYPQSLEDVTRYCQALSSHLSEGGIFISFGNNPFDRKSHIQYKPYGFNKEYSAEKKGDNDGAWVDYYVDGINQPIRNYNLFPETYNHAFALAGLKLFWNPPSLHPAEQNNPYWEDFFEDQPPFHMMIATKGASPIDIKKRLAGAFTL